MISERVKQSANIEQSLFAILFSLDRIYGAARLAHNGEVKLDKLAETT